MATPSSTRALSPDDVLPLSCTRQGTCCHGKAVWINPWELATLAHTLHRSSREVIETHTCDGGVRLRFDGASRWRGMSACSLYSPDSGCRVHAGRPLACRLYPLGRERQGTRLRYLHEGPGFPCLSGCPGVTQLPLLSVRDYLQGQGVSSGEAVCDAYLEMVQDLAEGAFVLVLDSGLITSGFSGLRARWQATMRADAAERAELIPKSLLWLLLDPGLAPEPAAAFVPAHAQLLQERLQGEYAALQEPLALALASSAMLALALHLAAGLGADLQMLAQRWMQVADEQGMR
jgi:Fe-S-cluster containining protein